MLSSDVGKALGWESRQLPQRGSTTRVPLASVVNTSLPPPQVQNSEHTADVTHTSENTESHWHLSWTHPNTTQQWKHSWQNTHRSEEAKYQSWIFCVDLNRDFRKSPMYQLQTKLVKLFSWKHENYCFHEESKHLSCYSCFKHDLCKAEHLCHSSSSGINKMLTGSQSNRERREQPMTHSCWDVLLKVSSQVVSEKSLIDSIWVCCNKKNWNA